MIVWSGKILSVRRDSRLRCGWQRDRDARA